MLQVWNSLEAKSSAHSLDDFAAQRIGSKDWRTSGLLEPPQQQGDCGACWAFAGVHAVVDSLRIAHKRNYSMVSVQQMLCLDSNFLRTPNGCEGSAGSKIMKAMSFGFRDKSICQTGMVNTTDYVIRCGAVVESCKPYPASHDGRGNRALLARSCKDPRALSTCADKSLQFYAARPLPPLAGVGYVDLTKRGADRMRAAIDKGPITASFIVCNDFQDSFTRDPRQWPGGIYFQARQAQAFFDCTYMKRQADGEITYAEDCGAHEVELVGYGTYIYIGTRGIDYWLVGTTIPSFSPRCACRAFCK
jgi:hypothetical protein